MNPSPRTRKTRGASGQTHVIPYRAVGDPAVRALAALLELQRPTVRAVAHHLGKATDSAHHQLVQLRAIGAVSQPRGTQGTLRTRVRITKTLG